MKRAITVLLPAILFVTSAQAGSAGFRELSVSDGTDRPLQVGLWYPTDAAPSKQRLGTGEQLVAPGAAVAGRALPLVVLSHGTGGWYGSHVDTALALAEAGFVVAALSHTGDTYDDHSRAARTWDRPRQLHRLIDFMLSEWPEHAQLDAAKVGAFGFSAGGFTVLVAAGGTPDFSKIAAHCAAHPDFYDCRLLEASTQDTDAGPAGPPIAFVHDPRITAAVVAAPALGYTFAPGGLKGVTAEVQLWQAENDRILPGDEYAPAARDALPKAPEFHLVANADHYDFLSTCSAQLAHIAPEICLSREGFDRAAFHGRFNANVVRFFERALKAKPTSAP
ncbi:MAG: prolyl oligopeptidase family serine peptidase [Deltaproteobacteria bacterium]|nr:prolyl oligopeptidase family serine peptidase [Deltaproteobacteria bacterium]